jgi:hypothetical protein
MDVNTRELDTTAAPPLSVRPLVSLLRSSLFIAIVSLFVLTGFAHGVFGDCCEHDKQQTQSAKTAPDKKAPQKSDDCRCLCHQVISHLTVDPVRVVAGELVPMALRMHANEFPPDAVPLGIDVPPQLA